MEIVSRKAFTFVLLFFIHIKQYKTDILWSGQIEKKETKFFHNP